MPGLQILRYAQNDNSLFPLGYAQNDNEMLGMAMKMSGILKRNRTL